MKLVVALILFPLWAVSLYSMEAWGIEKIWNWLAVQWFPEITFWDAIRITLLAGAAKMALGFYTPSKIAEMDFKEKFELIIFPFVAWPFAVGTVWIAVQVMP